MSADQSARSRRDHAALCARQAVPGTEVAQNVHAGLPQPGYLSRERRQSHFAGRGGGLPPHRGHGNRWVHAARWSLHHHHGELEQEGRPEQAWIKKVKSWPRSSRKSGNECAPEIRTEWFPATFQSRI